MLRNSGRKWTRFSGGRARESRWDNTNLPHSRVGITGNEDRRDIFSSPGISQMGGRFPNVASDNISHFGSPFEEVRNKSNFNHEPWGQQQLFTPSSGFNYPDVQFSSGSPSIQQSSTPFVDPNLDNNFQNSQNQSFHSPASNFNHINNNTGPVNTDMNFSGNRIPETPSFSSGNQIIDNSVNQKPASVPYSSSRLPVFPSTSSTNKRINPFSFANHDSQAAAQQGANSQNQYFGNNGQNLPFSAPSAYPNQFSQSSIPMNIVNPFARAAPIPQHRYPGVTSGAQIPSFGTSHFTPPALMEEENRAYIQLYQHLHRENVEKEKHTRGQKKTDFAEFPTGNVTPEKYLGWRHGLEMTASVQGVNHILDPLHKPLHIEFGVPPPRNEMLPSSKVVNYWAGRVHQGMAECWKTDYNYMASVMVYTLRNSKSASKFIRYPNVNPREIIQELDSMYLQQTNYTQGVKLSEFYRMTIERGERFPEFLARMEACRQELRIMSLMMISKRSCN